MLKALLRRAKVPVLRRMFATVRPLPSVPTSVQPSRSEVSAGQLNARNLELAVRHLHRDGLVVIEDVIPHEHLNHLNAKMVEDACVLQARGDKGPFNYNQGNLQQDAPPVAKYFEPLVFANSVSIQITSAVLGPLPKWTFCSGNTAMPPLPSTSPQRQPVHSDADLKFPSHPFALVVNVPLVSMTPENGSTELWLGTHNFDVAVQEGLHGERASGRIKETFLQKQRELRPPSQPVIKKGSIIVRDLRLWHAGMPNHSSEVRVMLAMIHFAPWYRNRMRLQLGEDVKPIVSHQVKGLQIPVERMSVASAWNGYLDRGFGNSYDFDQVP